MSLPEFFALTPWQMLRTFFVAVPTGAETPELDSVAITKKVNELAAARGEQPVIPFHMFKGVPRGGDTRRQRTKGGR